MSVLCCIRLLRHSSSPGHQVTGRMSFAASAFSCHSRSPDHQVTSKMTAICCIHLQNIQGHQDTRSPEKCPSFATSASSRHSRRQVSRTAEVSRIFVLHSIRLQGDQIRRSIADCLSPLHQPPKGVQGQQVTSRMYVSRCIRLHSHYSSTPISWKCPFNGYVLVTYICLMSHVCHLIIFCGLHPIVFIFEQIYSGHWYEQCD
jgi:hypothetical protein